MLDLDLQQMLGHRQAAFYSPITIVHPHEPPKHPAFRRQGLQPHQVPMVVPLDYPAILVPPLGRTIGGTALRDKHAARILAYKACDGLLTYGCFHSIFDCLPELTNYDHETFDLGIRYIGLRSGLATPFSS